MLRKMRSRRKNGFLKKRVFRNIHQSIIHFMQIILLFVQEKLKSAYRRVSFLSVKFANYFLYRKTKMFWKYDSDWV